MEPAFKAGDLVLGWRWLRLHKSQVVVLSTDERYLIKRVASLEGDKVWLEGDNASASTDSRSHGAYPTSQVEAVIIYKF